MDEPVVYEIKGGWAAAGQGWAVHAETREEALRKFAEAKRQHDEIRNKPPFYQQSRSVPAQF